MLIARIFIYLFNLKTQSPIVMKTLMFQQINKKQSRENLIIGDIMEVLVKDSMLKRLYTICC
jgi:hypothetical protein